MNNILKTGVAALALSILTIPAVVQADTLENMERERSILIDTMLDTELTAKDRQSKVEISKHRLIDLERMVLRDDSLRGRNTPHVRRAFGNYDLTFLVHTAAEKEVSIIDNWLEQLGVTTHKLMSADRGRR